MKNKWYNFVDNVVAMVALALLAIGALDVLALIVTLGHGIYNAVVLHVVGGLWVTHALWLIGIFVADLVLLVGIFEMLNKLRPNTTGYDNAIFK